MCTIEAFFKILIILCRGPLQFCGEPGKPGHQVIKSSALEVCKIHTEVFEPSSPSQRRHDPPKGQAIKYKTA